MLSCAGARKAASLEDLDPDVIATGNIGCMLQIAGALDAAHASGMLSTTLPV